MTEGKTTRLSKVAREFNVGISTIVDFLTKKGYKIESNPNTKISSDLYDLLSQEYSTDISIKRESEKVHLRTSREKAQKSITIGEVEEEEIPEEEKSEPTVKDTARVAEPEVSSEKPESKLKILGKLDIDSIEKKITRKKEEKKPAEEEVKEEKTETKEKKDVKPEEQPPKPVKKSQEESSEPEVVDKEEIEEEVEDNFPEEKDQMVESDSLKELKKKRTDENGMEVKVLGKIDLTSMNQRTRPARKSKEEKEKERLARKQQKQKAQPTKDEKKGAKPEETLEEENIQQEKRKDKDIIKPDIEKLSGPTIVGKMALPDKKAQTKKDETQDSDEYEDDGKGKKRKRKRIRKDKERINIEDKNFKEESREKVAGKKPKKKIKNYRPEISEEDVEKQIKDTLARLTHKGKSKGAKYRREKRDAISQRMQEEVQKKQDEKNILKVSEFVSVNELANMMEAPVNEVIATCMNLGLFVSINQRLDAETLSIVAEEFNYKVEFVSVDDQEEEEEIQEEDEKNLLPRSPIVTVMGHVDHGKTKLLDYIRNANVIAGEAGGITQHIGAYSVALDDGRQITFLDTPGHEAFTAMRARGAQITDVAIIVVAADDGVMPQTVEAINHASAAGVPIVFAINKIDKPTSNPEKIKEELANMNYLVEDWGGKYQSQEISAKNGINISDLLEKVLLEAEILELKANPNKKAQGTIIESSLDKGRGYIATVLVETGTLHIGDVMLAGTHFGHVKAMYNERNAKITEAGPASPVLILGLNGAPQAGDKFKVVDSDREAKEIANKREQFQREQDVRTQKHITLDEIGRRIAIGNFQELNVIVKGDVDGSVEALSDALIKLSTEEIQVNIKHKAVGQISESDILLAAASNAIVVGFQVRPSISARKLAEKEEIEIRLYSIIYDAIEEIKAAMEGMLSPEIKEEITGSAEVKDIFKITKVGTVAGCLVREGKIFRNTKVRVIRDGIVIYTGELGSLKRIKDDVKEVVSGLECGLNIQNFNDIKVGDIIEGFREFEVKKKL